MSSDAHDYKRVRLTREEAGSSSSQNVLETELQQQKELVKSLQSQITFFQRKVEELRKEQVSKTNIHKFLGSVLQLKPSPDVLVDITLDEGENNMVMVGRPPVTGSSSKQMRHVTPYAFVKNIIKAGISQTQNVQYLLIKLSNAVISFMQSDCGIALKKSDYDQLGANTIYSIKLKTSKDEYYFIDNPKLDYNDIFVKLGLQDQDAVDRAHADAHALYLRKKKKFLEYAMKNLQDALSDENTVGIACEALSRFVFTLFNQKPHTAFPEEGNSLNYEIRLYKSLEDTKNPKDKEYRILSSAELKYKLAIGEDLNERIRIVDCEGNGVRKTIEALKLLVTIIVKYNDKQNYSSEVNEYNTKNPTLRLSDDSAPKQSKIEFIASCNKELDIASDVAKQIPYHIAKLLYFVFDFKPLEIDVFVPSTLKELSDASITKVKVFPSSAGPRQASYIIKDGAEYRQDQKNAAKGYNKNTTFRDEVLDLALLARKVVDHIFITIKSFEALKYGIEGSENSSQKGFLQAFSTLIAHDYKIDADIFFTGLVKNACKGLINDLLGESASGGSSDSEILEASKLAGDSNQKLGTFDDL